MTVLLQARTKTTAKTLRNIKKNTYFLADLSQVLLVPIRPLPVSSRQYSEVYLNKLVINSRVLTILLTTGREFICISQTECKHPFIGCRAFLASQYHHHQLSYALPTRSGAICTKHVLSLFPPSAVPSKLLFAYPGSPVHPNSQNVI